MEKIAELIFKSILKESGIQASCTVKGRREEQARGGANSSRINIKGTQGKS